MQRFLQATLSLLLLCQGFALLMALEKPAYGYVDPGSGLLMFQVGGSMIAGAIFCLRSKVRKFLGLASKDEKKASSDKSISITETEQ